MDSKGHICDKDERIRELEEEVYQSRFKVEIGTYFIDALFSKRVIWLIFLVSFIYNLFKGG